MEVTAEDIAYGKARDCDKCPIARAVQRATGDPALGVHEEITYSEEVHWDDRRSYVVARYKNYTRDRSFPLIELPPEGQAFVDAIDVGQQVQPFAFEIEVPDA